MRVALRRKVHKILAVVLVAVTVFGLVDTGRMTTYAYDEKTGMWKNEYTVVSLDRAHSLPCEINLELLVENNFVLPLHN